MACLVVTVFVINVPATTVLLTIGCCTLLCVAVGGERCLVCLFLLMGCLVVCSLSL